jgi:hypothetical protein
MLVFITATESIADLLRVVKTNSSRWVHEQFPEQKSFGWQAGYAAFTVSVSRAADVTKYIAAQQEHHHRVSFQDEFLTLLRKHGMPYDERDLWG